jgi:hypothetical protein
MSSVESTEGESPCQQRAGILNGVANRHIHDVDLVALEHSAHSGHELVEALHRDEVFLQHKKSRRPSGFAGETTNPLAFLGVYFIAGGGIPNIFAGLIFSSRSSSCSVKPLFRRVFAQLASASGWN